MIGGLGPELLRPVLKWGAITTAFFILLFVFIGDIRDGIQTVAAKQAEVAILLDKHAAATEVIADEMRDLRAVSTTQNKAIIRLLELSCLKTAETFVDRRDCQQAREGQ